MHCQVRWAGSMVACMKGLQRSFWNRWWVVVCCVLLAPGAGWAEQASTSANSAFDLYAKQVEARLGQQRKAADDRAIHNGSSAVRLGSGVLGAEVEARLRRGEMVIEQLSSSSGKVERGAMLHHWRGTAFVPGSRAEDFVWLMQDFPDYPRHYAPQIVRSEVLGRDGNQFSVRLRVKQHHVLTVVMDTTYDVRFGNGYSESRSTEVEEIEDAGTKHERKLTGAEQHGYLWRLNSYWSYAERDGGLYIQIESVSLTRDVPHGLGWIVGPFVQSIPRESLEFTLGRTRDALRKTR